MLITIAFIAAFLLATGYLRAVIESKKPGFILNANEVLKAWITENKWMSYFTPVFALLLFLIILLSWVVYGLISIADFLALILKHIWQGMVWVWTEVVNPTVVSLIKLLWHYVFVTGFRFFKNAITAIPESLKYSNLKISFRNLILPFLLTTILTVLYILTLNLIVQVIASIIVFYLFQYAVFNAVSAYRSELFPQKMVMPGFRLSVIWLGFASVSTAVMVLLKQYADIYVISSLSITLVQILLPLCILFGLAFIMSTLYLPAFMAEAKTDFSVFSFWKRTLIRLPKLIFSQPFQLIGLGLISLIPLTFIVIFSFTIDKITGENLLTHTQHAIQMDYHLPAIEKNKNEIAKLNQLSKSNSLREDSVIKDFDKRINEMRGELEEAVTLKDAIKSDQIHTFNRNAFTGEYQSFSYPDIQGCDQVTWRIVNAESGRTVKSQRIKGSTGTSVFYHEWKSPGKYLVSVKTPSTCNSPFEKSIEVEVVAASDSTEIPETRYFVTKEAANYAIDLLNTQLSDIQNSKKKEIIEVQKSKLIYADSIEHLRFKSREHIHMLIAKVLTLFGLMILSLLSITFLWTYFVTYHFDMYGYGQDNDYYIQRLGKELQQKNPNQPYLGILILMLIALAVFVLMKTNLQCETFNQLFQNL